MLILIIILVIMWLASAISLMSDIAPAARELPAWQNFLIFSLVIIGSPILLVAQSIQLVFETILPEGGNDNDKFEC